MNMEYIDVNEKAMAFFDEVIKMHRLTWEFVADALEKGAFTVTTFYEIDGWELLRRGTTRALEKVNEAAFPDDGFLYSVRNFNKDIICNYAEREFHNNKLAYFNQRAFNGQLINKCWCCPFMDDSQKDWALCRCFGGLKSQFWYACGSKDFRKAAEIARKISELPVLKCQMDGETVFRMEVVQNEPGSK